MPWAPRTPEECLELAAQHRDLLECWRINGEFCWNCPLIQLTPLRAVYHGIDFPFLHRTKKDALFIAGVFCPESAEGQWALLTCKLPDLLCDEHLGWRDLVPNTSGFSHISTNQWFSIMKHYVYPLLPPLLAPLPIDIG